MMHWYLKFAQSEPAMNTDDLQKWIYNLQQTFNLMSFGRIDFRFVNTITDRNSRTMISFRSTPDPTLPEYFVRIRLDLNKNIIEIITMKDMQPLPMETVPIGPGDLLQTPYQIAESVKRSISYTSQIDQHQGS